MVSRRSLLRGLLATVAAGPIVARLPVIADWEPYGRSPAMDCLPDFRFLEGLSQKLAQTIWYGNAETTPTQFCGFTPVYDPPAFDLADEMALPRYAGVPIRCID